MERKSPCQCEVIYRRTLAPGVFEFFLDAPEIAGAAVPGQFVHILLPGRQLRRPISVCDADAETGVLRIVFEVRGGGTELLSQTPRGARLDLLGPLGRGFELPAGGGDPVLLVGGGIGVPPLLYLARQLGDGAVAALGFRSREAALLERDFARVCRSTHVATEDGSAGYHGYVTDCARALSFRAVCACGPAPMLRAAEKLAQQRGVPCQLSLERRMACGVGACLGCAVRLRDADGHEGYGRVCKDGPVFRAEEIVWEEEAERPG